MTKADATNELIAQSLAGGMTVADVAKSVNLTERSVYRRLAEDPTLKARVNELRSQMLDSVVGKLATLAGAAHGTLAKAMLTAPSALSVRAALGVLDSVIKLRTSVEVDERLRALEEANANRK